LGYKAGVSVQLVRSEGSGRLSVRIWAGYSAATKGALQVSLVFALHLRINVSLHTCAHFAMPSTFHLPAQISILEKAPQEA
jgi:hypothetical protein